MHLHKLRNLLDHCGAAWNKLIDQPWRIMSIGLRDWATGSDQRELVLLVNRGGAAGNAVLRHNWSWAATRLDNYSKYAKPDATTTALIRRYHKRRA
jgi:hypothetical protein